MEFPQYNDKIFRTFIPTKDFNKMLDICHKRQVFLLIKFEIGTHHGAIELTLQNPGLKVRYEEVGYEVYRDLS